VSKYKYNEKEIMEQLKDPALRSNAFSLVVRQHSQEIYWHIRRMVLVHDDANDLVQETFIKAWSNIGNFQGKSKISTWLYRIAINETLTFLNKRSNNISLDSPEGAVADTLESDAHFCGDRADAIFQEAISHLPQICAFSDVSFSIEKFSDQTKTHTKINKLNQNDKIKEIVRIIGGDENSQTAIKHAEEMILRANQYKS
jgi:RNA polymerase sigma-70 factor (ECF subfamily)